MGRTAGASMCANGSSIARRRGMRWRCAGVARLERHRGFWQKAECKVEEAIEVAKASKSEDAALKHHIDYGSSTAALGSKMRYKKSDLEVDLRLQRDGSIVSHFPFRRAASPASEPAIWGEREYQRYVI